MKKLIYSFFTFFLISVVYGQQISGNVSDQNGQPLPGVNILSAANKTAVSDFDGNFTIDAIKGEELTFTMIGFTTKKAKAFASMRVGLTEEVNMLNEVVAIGYGTKKSGSITGSVTRIKTEDIIRTPAQNAVQAIQGKSAGVNIVTNDEPGANPTIRIRGLGTVLSNRDPLYIINGVETNGLNGLNPNDIATMDILKDASSLAIYGQKGSNGVVIITTKTGKKGEIKVSYDGYYGQKEIQNEVKMADSYRFAYYNNSALGSSSYFNFNQPYNTNWLKEITRTGEVSNNSVSLSGASENSNYYLSFNHYTEKGVLIGTDYKRTNIINKNEYKLLDDKFKITHFANVAIFNNVPKPLSAFTNAYKQSPIVPVKYNNGRWGVPMVNRDNGLNDIGGTNYTKYNNVGNPVAQIYNDNQENKGVTLTGSLLAELKILPSLTYTSSFGVTAEWNRGYTFSDLRQIYLTQNPFLSDLDYDKTFGDKPIINNSLEQRRGEYYNWNWDNYLTYKKEFGVHQITAVAGISRTTGNNSETLTAKRYNVPAQSNYWYLDLANINSDENGPRAVVGNKHETPRVSLAYFARAEYELMNKYLLTAIVRREGLSTFQESKRWDTFPSLSAGWVISNEEFLKNSSIVNNLKLRAGYGEVGNGNGPENFLTFSTSVNYPFGPGQNINPGSYIAREIDPNLTWETMKELDFGLDFSLLKNKLSGTFDYYDRKSDGIILELQIPPVLSEGKVIVNSGEITNKGIEASLRWEDSINDNFKYWISGNFSKNENTISRADNPYFTQQSGSGSLNNGEWTKAVVKGDALGSFYVFEQTGYSNDGTPIYNDINGDGKLTDVDRVNAGSYIPTYTYGINLGFTYRNIDFSVDTYGVGGNKIYNGKKAQRSGGENVEYDILDNFWTPSNPNAENPKPFDITPRPSTYYIEDGSFLRINNITLGYTLPKMFDKLSKVRLYATAVNPFVFTNYSGFSPEVVGGDNGNPLGSAGIELDAYPTNRTYLVGVNVSF